MNGRPIVMPDGFVIYKISHTMGGRTAPLAVTRYGQRYYFRDLGPSEEESRCSFSIKADELRAALDQADDDPGVFGDVVWMGIGCQGGVRPKDGTPMAEDWDDDEEDDEDEEVIPEDDPDNPGTARHWIQAKLEGFL